MGVNVALASRASTVELPDIGPHNPFRKAADCSTGFTDTPVRAFRSSDAACDQRHEPRPEHPAFLPDAERAGRRQPELWNLRRAPLRSDPLAAARQRAPGLRSRFMS